MKKAKFFVSVTVAALVAGGALALKAHRGVDGDILLCDNGVCASSPFSSTDKLGGVQLAPTSQMYQGAAGAKCGTPQCHEVNFSTVWFHPKY